MKQDNAPFHCLVWIDHAVARIYAVHRQNLTELSVIHAPDRGRGHVHHQAGTMGPGHEPPTAEFLEKTMAAITGASEILLAGPADAKHALKRHMHAHAPALDRHVIGVETIGDCGLHQLHEFASRIFHRVDRMGPAAP